TETKGSPPPCTSMPSGRVSKKVIPTATAPPSTSSTSGCAGKPNGPAVNSTGSSASTGSTCKFRRRPRLKQAQKYLGDCKIGQQPESIHDSGDQRAAGHRRIQPQLGEDKGQDNPDQIGNDHNRQHGQADDHPDERSSPEDSQKPAGCPQGEPQKRPHQQFLAKSLEPFSRFDIFSHQGPHHQCCRLGTGISPGID